MNKNASKTEWERVPWHGNPAQSRECWRRKFGRGIVYIGIGEFQAVIFSFGPDSEDSFSGTRWNYIHPPYNEEEMKCMVEYQMKLRRLQPGCWSSRPPRPAEEYRNQKDGPCICGKPGCSNIKSPFREQ